MAAARTKLERIEGKPGKVTWYWFHPSLLTVKGNWRKSPDGIYLDPIKVRQRR